MVCAKEMMVEDEDESLKNIRKALNGLSFGEVRVVVQDGKVIQVERIERMRISNRGKR